MAALPELTTDELMTVKIALAFLILHHTEGMKEAKDSALRFPRQKRGCLRVATHHQEQIYQTGELIVKLGGRNGWPRP